MKTATRARITAADERRRLAVLIDADNAQPSVVEGPLLAEVAEFGVASVKRIYADRTSKSHAQWKKHQLAHSITPAQQFAYTTGKNATDSMMITDAMDLMYSRRLDAFCLVSSDSDFTRLAQRLRDEGLWVLGFGDRKTPESFVDPCHQFVYTEVLRPLPPNTAKPVGDHPVTLNRTLRADATTKVEFIIAGGGSLVAHLSIREATRSASARGFAESNSDWLMRT